MINTGISNLSEALKVLNDHIDNSPYANIFENSFLLENSTELLLELLIIKPIILYVKKGALSSNNAYLKIDNFSYEIIGIEDIYSLLILRNLQLSDQKKYEINWIACEAPAAIKKSVFLSNICFIDVFLERNENTGKNSVGRIDYEKIENLFVDMGGKKFIRDLTTDKRCKYFISCVLKIFLSSKKNKYENKVSINSTLDKYKITNDDITKVYRCKCQECDEVYSVILYGSEKNGDMYIEPKDIMYLVQHDKKQYSQMICKNCWAKDRDILPLCFLEKYPDSDNEINQAFLKLYHSLMIDEDLMLEESRKIMGKSQKMDDENDAKLYYKIS